MDSWIASLIESTHYMPKSSIEIAREVRAHKARIMGDLRVGAITVPEALRNNSPAFSGLDLWGVLVAAHKLGPTGAQKICKDAGITLPNVITLGELSKADKDRIIAALPKRARP